MVHGVNSGAGHATAGIVSHHVTQPPNAFHGLTSFSNALFFRFHLCSLKTEIWGNWNSLLSSKCSMLSSGSPCGGVALAYCMLVWNRRSELWECAGDGLRIGIFRWLAANNMASILVSGVCTCQSGNTWQKRYFCTHQRLGRRRTMKWKVFVMNEAKFHFEKLSADWRL